MSTRNVLTIVIFYGKFLGWAQEKCNVVRHTINFTPVIGHNIQNYYLHHICLAFKNQSQLVRWVLYPAATKIMYIVRNGVSFKTIKKKIGNDQKCSITSDSLSHANFNTLPCKNWLITYQCKIFRFWTSTLQTKWRRNDVWYNQKFVPYSYMANRENFVEKEDYHKLYLKCDTLLLACVFEEFRQISHQTYGMFCAHFFSASNLAGDAFNCNCKNLKA